MLIEVFFALSVCAFAQDSASPPSDNSPTSKNTTQTAEPPVLGRQQARPQKEEKKKEKKKSSEPDDVTAATFSEAVANAVIRRLHEGLEGHSQRLLLSAFDAERMDDYVGFENQIEAFFNHYASFRSHFRIVQATSEAEKAIVTTQIEMEAIPGGEAPPVRKQHQLRLQLERGSKGWKIVDLKPRDFFS